MLANFFNSLLTKKSGSGATGTPGGGNSTPGTVRKSGEETERHHFQPGQLLSLSLPVSVFSSSTLSTVLLSPPHFYTSLTPRASARASQRMLATLRCVGDGCFLFGYACGCHGPASFFLFFSLLWV